ncbi:unnamed protein product [Calicophoron daubneyi]|uniref:N-acetyltransferase domain-containing protein n=1 Tax=Calicophoron daubneyi TaxID=300641 RepID=A0AAV2TMH1_CALDB
MRINADTLVETNRLYLVPYCKFHVTQYHQWMLSESLRQATCSEQLSLEEEHEAQRLWQELDDRLTFIVLNKATILSSVNIGNLCETYVVPEDVEVKAMIGDVNMFITDYDGSDILCARALHINLGDYTPKDNETYFEAEVSVMIADENVRGRGLAAEALAGMLEFASKHLLLKPYSLVAKVSVDNPGSMRLFKDHFGFVERARQEVFHQVELVPPPDLFSRVAPTTPEKKFKPDDLLAATSTLIVNSLAQTSKEFRGVDWIYHEKDVNKWRKGLI